MSQPGLRNPALLAKGALSEFRRSLGARHEAGENPLELAKDFTSFVERTIAELAEATVSAVPLPPHQSPGGELPVTIVAIGGFGRGDLAPYSDIDLLILIDPDREEELRPWVRRFSQDLYDANLQPAISVRDPREACQSALRDATIYTSMVEARRVWGGSLRFESFRLRFSRLARRRGHALIEAALAARREERSKYGETVYLLSPNVKRSRGGLRDLQLVRWVGFARYGTCDYAALANQGALSVTDLRQIEAAHRFLLKVRFELHLRAGKGQDQLTREEQVRIAQRFGYAAEPGVLPVERFMTDYFENTSQVRYVAASFVETARARFGLRQIVGPVFSFNVGGDFRVGAVHVTATRQGLRKIQSDLVEVLRLMDLASTYDRRIDHSTWTAVREAMNGTTVIAWTPEVARRFLAILAEPRRLGDLLRRLHELRVLEKIVPAFRRARCLLQFNEYHKFTVDEHCIRAVEIAAGLAGAEGTTAGVYRQIRRPQLLHLALLLHDVGKGDERDHSIVGEELAEQTCIRLGVDFEGTTKVRFLVRHHLKMAHLALWRNINDDAVVAGFAAEVPDVDTLRMLYILTYADLAAVGPEVLNVWKVDLLTELYLRTFNQLTGKANRDASFDDKARLRLEASDRLAVAEPSDWRRRALDRIPNSFLEQLDVAGLLERLESWRQVTEDQPRIALRPLERSDCDELVIAAVDRPKSGFFHRTTGTLTSMRFEILSVDAVDLPDGKIANRYLIRDLEGRGETAEARREACRDRIRRVLIDPTERPPAFKSIWRPQRTSLVTASHRPPSRVKIDNETAEGMTIIDVFTSDRTGLLYGVSRVIFELGLEVRYAKIGTHLDQVVDVFYVTDEQGGKITDPERLRAVVDALMAFLESLGDEP